jgi:subtilisin family serine protease
LAQPFPGAGRDAILAAVEDADAEFVDELTGVDLFVIRVGAGSLQRTAAGLFRSGNFETLHKNYIYEPDRIPNDSRFVDQEYLTLARIPEAWDLTTGEAGIIVAVVDTGVDANHPQLRDRLLPGWNVYDNNAELADVLGHGTSVAGVVGAKADEGEGTAGVTWDCPLLPVRVGDRTGRSTGRHVAAGILWAVDHDARVINVSFAPLWSDRVVQSAAQYAYSRGAVVVISAGNGGSTASAAGYEQALFVGAVDGQRRIAQFSDRGPFIDLVAPGTEILTTSRGGGYAAIDGTSFAAPLVAGVAALAWSVSPELRPISIVEALLGSALDLGPAGADDTYGRGLVDARRAVEKALSTQVRVDAIPPTLTVEYPADGETVSGKTIAVVTARDAGGVADIVLLIDDVPFATDTREPYRFMIDTALFSAGRHELTFVAGDDTGNRSQPARVSVTFAAQSIPASSPSIIRFTSPAEGASVTGDVTIRATISDPDGLAVVEWRIDGESVFVAAVSGTSSGVSFRWRTAGVSTGSHTITLTVTDSSGLRTSTLLPLFK